MSEVVVVPTSSGFGDKSVDELNELLDAMTPVESQFQPTEAPVEPEPTPEAPAEPEPEAEPEPVPEVDLAASEREGERLRSEKLEAALALQQAHASRLAGEIGYLKQKIESGLHASEPYEPQSQAELDRLSLLEQRLEKSENERLSNQVSQAVSESIGSLDGPWVQELKDEIAVVGPKYADQLRAASETTDPALARQLATGVAMMVKAEATQMRWEKNHEAMKVQKQAASADMARAKKAQAPSGSGGVPSPPPKQKTIADMSASEADQWLKANFR